MDDFTVKPGLSNQFRLVQGEANAIAPDKRPLSSMAPTVALRDGRVSLVLGSQGGPRIITTILETVLNILDYDMTPQEAVDAPRLHHQWLPDEILIEPFALSSDTQALLQRMGYRIREQRRWGAAELIQVGVPPSVNAVVSGRLRSGFTMVQAIRAAQPARRLAIRAPNWTVDGWRRGPLIRERSLSGLALPPGILSHRKLVAFQRNAKCPPCQTASVPPWP